jgi:hypothetical protein
MEVKAKRRVVVIVVALLSMTLGALGTGYALKRNCIEPDVSLTVNTSSTTIKMVDDQGESVGEISGWKGNPIVVRIQRHR